MHSVDTGLLVMDFQTGIAETEAARPSIAEAAEALAKARAAGMAVFFVKVGFRPGHPEICPEGTQFSAIRAAGRLVEPDIIPEVAPLPSEPVVTKHRISALAETELPTLLRAQGVRHLVMAGISTSGVILSTTRAAADLDFRITILADAVHDPDPEIHAFLLERILPKQAMITTVAGFFGGA